MMALEKDDYKSAYNYLDSVYRKTNENVGERLEESPIISQREYYNDKAKYEREQKNKLAWILSVSLGFAVLIACVLMIHSRMKAKIRNLEVENLMNEIKALRDSSLCNERKAAKSENIISVEETLLADKEQTMEKSGLEEEEKSGERVISFEQNQDPIRISLFRQQFSTLNKLFDEYFLRADNAKSEKQILENIYRELQSFRSKKKLQGLEQEVNLHMNDIVGKLRRECAFIKDSDFTFLILLYAGFTAKAVCIILDLNIKNFYAKRARLLAKIKESDIPHKDEFIRYIK